MDKFKRASKTSPQHNSTSTRRSCSPSTAAKSSTTKITIEQKVASGAAKKGLYSVKRSVDPNDLVIKRRLGEGSKPIFSRPDIRVNHSASPKRKPSPSSSSDSSDSDDRSPCKQRTSKTEDTKSKSEKKVPYFLDEKRENDRIKRIYGQTRRSRSSSIERRRRHARSRSRTPPPHNRRMRRRSNSRYRSRPHSRSRSRSRERYINPRDHYYHHRNHSDDDRQRHKQTTKFIPVPVPVEYPFMFPTWGPPMMPPMPRFPYPVRHPLPPPFPYMSRQFRPSRFVPNAFPKGNYRPRQY